MTYLDLHEPSGKDGMTTKRRRVRAQDPEMQSTKCGGPHFILHTFCHIKYKISAGPPTISWYPPSGALDTSTDGTGDQAFASRKEI